MPKLALNVLTRWRTKWIRFASSATAALLIMICNLRSIWDVVERKSLAISQAFPSEAETLVFLENVCREKDIALDVANCVRGLDSQLELLPTIHGMARHTNDRHVIAALAIVIGFVLVLGIVRVCGRVLDLLWFLCLLELLVLLGRLVILALLGLGKAQDGRRW